MTDSKQSQQSLEYTGKYASVLIFGPPGAGKGTISRVIAQAGNMVHLSTGDIFRAISADLPAGQLVRSFSNKGMLVPDEVTVDIWQHYVNGLIATNRYYPSQQLLLLDGIPRTLPQAELLDAHIDVRAIIKVSVEDESVLIERLKGRAKKEGRADDADEVVLRKRMEVYHAQTAAVLEHYPSDLVIDINGDQTPLKVLGEVLAKGADALTFDAQPQQAR